MEFPTTSPGWKIAEEYISSIPELVLADFVTLATPLEREYGRGLLTEVYFRELLVAAREVVNKRFVRERLVTLVHQQLTAGFTLGFQEYLVSKGWTLSRNVISQTDVWSNPNIDGGALVAEPVAVMLQVQREAKIQFEQYLANLKRSK